MIATALALWAYLWILQDKDVGRQPQRARDYAAELSAFRDSIGTIDQTGMLYDAAAITENGEIVITVDDFWYSLPGYKRERWAKSIWFVWVVAGESQSPRVYVQDQWKKLLATVDSKGGVHFEEKP